MLKSETTQIIKLIAAELGFSFCGISKSEFLKDEAPRFEEWLHRGYSGTMNYLKENFDKRLDPRLLVPDSKSVISLMYNYFPEKDFAKNSKLKIAKYAYGEDYHFVVKEKIPAEQKGKFENWIFGCDICQDVCTWNRFSKPHSEPKFDPHPDLEKMGTEDWEEITEEVFQKLFKKSAVKRTKFEGLKRNIRFLRD